MYPSLFEIEKAVRSYCRESLSIKKLKESEWVWNKLPCLAKLLSPLSNKWKRWSTYFLLPLLVEGCLHHLDRMQQGLWNKHEEDKLHVLRLFLKEPDVFEIVRSKAPGVLSQYILKESPSFWKQREFFQNACAQVGLVRENCSWLHNELYSHYVARMKKRLDTRMQDGEKKAQKSFSPVLHSEIGRKSLKNEVLFSEESLIFLCKIQERVRALLDAIEEVKKQSFRVKNICFLLRMEDEESYMQTQSFESDLVNYSVFLEEMSSNLAEDVLKSQFENEVALKAYLKQEYAHVICMEEEVQQVRTKLTTQIALTEQVKKKLNNRVKALSKKLDAIILVTPPHGLRLAQDRLIGQAKQMVSEWKMGLTKLPGPLYSLVFLEEYVDSVVKVCHSFFDEFQKQQMEKKEGLSRG